MKRVFLVIIFLILTYAVFASPFTDSLKIFIGKKVDISYTYQSSGGSHIHDVVLVEVTDAGIIIETGDRTIFINKDYIVKIELKK